MTAQAKDLLVYFGTFDTQWSQGIYVSRLDSNTGKLSTPEIVAKAPNPNFLAISPNEKCLYAATREGMDPGKNIGGVRAFKINATTGALTLLNEQSCGGVEPCCVNLDATGKALFVANYDDGSVKTILVERDGSLGDGGTFIKFAGHSANPDPQAGPHAHWMGADPSNRWALACDLGTDKVMLYRLDSAGATVTAADPAFASAPPGSGVRHLKFSRNSKFAYAINEMGCSITTFTWDSRAGKLDPLETISALPANVSVQPAFTCAEIIVHPSGKYVYGTIRGHDSISVFAADSKSGRLSMIENVPSLGKVPRGLGIDPTGRWLIVGNQNSNSVVEFAINAETGRITPTGQEYKVGAPVDVKFVEAK